MRQRRRSAGPISGLAALRDENAASRLLGRLGGACFVVAGVILELMVPFLPEEDANPLLVAGVGAAVIAIGIALMGLPWDRWDRRALLIVPVAGLALLAVPTNRHEVGHLLIFYVTAFVFVGLTQERRWVYILAPVAVASFVTKYTLAETRELVELTDFVVVLVVSVALGAVLASAVAANRAAADTLDQVVGGSRLLVRAEGVEDVAEVFESTLTELVSADRSFTFVAEGAERRRLVLVSGAASGASGGAIAEAGAGALRLAGGDTDRETAADVLGAETMARLVPTLTEGRPVLIPELGASLLFEESLDVLPDIASVLVVPLPSERSNLGFALVGWTRPVAALSEYTEQAVELLVVSASSALEREQESALRSRAALTDQLTGLLNRRAIEKQLETLEVGDVVVAIDLDHFKKVNDEEGHAAGDRALRTLAACLVDFCRRNDWCGRLGGQEFVLVVRGSGSHPGRAVTRLRERWTALEPSTTFSAGVAVHDAADDPQQTLAHADAALHRAKDLGRDRVEQYQPAALRRHRPPA